MTNLADLIAQNGPMMDEIDHRLIAALRQDARASLSELAARLGITRATVRARMQRLQASGEIVGYGVITRADVQDAPVRAITMIAIEGRGADRIQRQLSGWPSVRRLHSTNGRWDVVVELVADSLPELDATLSAIRKLDGVSASETSLLLATRKAGR